MVKNTDPRGLEERRAVAESHVMKREGHGWQEIADRLSVRVVEAQELAQVAFGQMAIDTAENIRVEVEDRSQGNARAVARSVAGRAHGASHVCCWRLRRSGRACSVLSCRRERPMRNSFSD